MRLPERREACNKYLFTCNCQACREDWPMKLDLPDVRLKYLQNKIENWKLIIHKIFYSINRFKLMLFLLVRKAFRVEVGHLCASL